MEESVQGHPAHAAWHESITRGKLLKKCGPNVVLMNLKQKASLVALQRWRLAAKMPRKHSRRAPFLLSRAWQEKRSVSALSESRFEITAS